jgi:hypothetical protein
VGGVGCEDFRFKALGEGTGFEVEEGSRHAAAAARATDGDSGLAKPF